MRSLILSKKPSYSDGTIPRYGLLYPNSAGYASIGSIIHIFRIHKHGKQNHTCGKLAENCSVIVGMLWKGYGEADNAISLQLKSLLPKGFAHSPLHFPQRFHTHK